MSKERKGFFESIQARFSLSYILIIVGVLLLLNTYPLLVSEDLVFRSKVTTPSPAFRS